MTCGDTDTGRGAVSCAARPLGETLQETVTYSYIHPVRLYIVVCWRVRAPVAMCGSASAAAIWPGWLSGRPSCRELCACVSAGDRMTGR